MAIDKISLQALQAYNKVDSKNFGDGIGEIGGQAVSFRQMVENTFNSYATMSPDQILNKIRGVGNDDYRPSVSSIGNLLSTARANLNAHEQITKKALIGEASILELATSTTKASNTIKVIAAFRDQLIPQLDKIFSIQL